jgi:hypothetical protein
MKKARYTTEITHPDGNTYLHLYQYSKYRTTINNIWNRTMQALGHPCCGDGILGKNPTIENITNKTTEALMHWEAEKDQHILTLNLGPDTPPSDESK